MTKEEAHSRWGHPHIDQLNKMGNYFKFNLTGHLPTCAGCAVIKSRAMQTTRTCNKLALENGERLFIDTTGPYPKSRGGKKYWMCAVDDKTDKTWVHFANSKNHMLSFVKELVTTINGLDLKVKYIRCDNAGEHQQALQEYCQEVGITLEYTAPNTPKQNGRVEKKIHVVWQRAMTMMINANLTGEAQKDFWAEAVACSAFIEDLVIKAGRDTPALASWTATSVSKWVKHLVQFGRLAVVNKREKVSAKMKEKGFPAMMVGYALNHGAGTYRLFNPKTNRIIVSRDVKWMDFKSKQLGAEFDIFEPGIEDKPATVDITMPEITIDDDASISSNESLSASQSSMSTESSGENTSSNSTSSSETNEVEIEIMSSSSESSSSTSTQKPNNNSSDSSSSDKTTPTNSITTRQSKLSK